MKQRFKNGIKVLVAICLLGISGIILLVLNPSILYTYSTPIKGHIVYHDENLDDQTQSRILESLQLIQTSELYNDSLKFKICLDHNSFLPKLLNTIKGPAYGWGFINQIVLRGRMDSQSNTIEINDYKWNLSQLMAHELTHCLQMSAFGWLGSNPIKSYDDWKWEGYPEYISRQYIDQKSLLMNVTQMIKQDKKNKEQWAYNLSDSTIAPKSYYMHWILVQYCIDIKGMTYRQILADNTLNEEQLKREILDWYKDKQLHE